MPATATLELGVRFKSDVAGFIKGVRFYKSAANTGPSESAHRQPVVGHRHQAGERHVYGRDGLGLARGEL